MDHSILNWLNRVNWKRNHAGHDQGYCTESSGFEDAGFTVSEQPPAFSENFGENKGAD